MSISVLYIEDNIHFAKMLKNHLEEYDIEIKKIVTNVDDAYLAIAEDEYEIILVDIGLTPDGYEGLEIIKNIKNIKNINNIKNKVTAKIIAISGYCERSLILEAFQNGISEYVTKLNFPMLPNIIKMIIDNVSPSAVLLADYRHLRQEKFLNQFTDCEREIVGHINNNLSMKEICELTYRAESTVKSQIKSVREKLCVPSLHLLINEIKRWF